MSWRTNKGNKGNVQRQRMRYDQRMGLNWTDEEINLLTELFSEDNSISEIAVRLNRDEGAIVHKLISMEIVGFETEEFIPLRHGLPWYSDEIQRLQREWQEGKSIEQIALVHQRQKNAILHALITHRLINFRDRKILEKITEKTGSVSGQDADKLENGNKRNIGGVEVDIEDTGTKIVDEKPTFVGAVTGRNDAIFLKNKYQKELDKMHTAIRDSVENLKRSSNELTEIWAKVPAIKKNIEAHEQERAELYTNLGNLLTKETDFEDKMWKTTQKGRNVKSITVKQKFNESDVDEMRYDAMMEYIKQYPEYASKSTFRKIIDKIEQKEDEIRKENEKRNSYISDYNYRLNTFEKEIQRAEDKFADYERIKKEADEKLNNTRYNKSILNAFLSEQAKAEAKLDLLHHRLDQFRNTLTIIKSEHSGNKRKTFVDMEY